MNVLCPAYAGFEPLSRDRSAERGQAYVCPGQRDRDAPPLNRHLPRQRRRPAYLLSAGFTGLGLGATYKGEWLYHFVK